MAVSSKTLTASSARVAVCAADGGPGRRRPSIVWTGVAVGTVLLGFSPAVAANLALDRAIVLTETPFRTFGRSVHGQLFIAAPPPVVFATLTDYDHMAEFMPYVVDVHLLERASTRATVRFHLRYSGWLDVVEVDERQVLPFSRITWHAIQGPLKTSDGSWTLRAQTGGCQLDYQTDVDPGWPIPSTLTGLMVRRGLEAFLAGIRERVESGNRWHKPGP
jgi:ribosome-associated toxin RatA of RatAB toxin-antitoxin module